MPGQPPGMQHPSVMQHSDDTLTMWASHFPHPAHTAGTHSDPGTATRLTDG